MLRKTGPLGFLSNMLLPFFKCKESLGYVGIVVNYTHISKTILTFEKWEKHTR